MNNTNNNQGSEKMNGNNEMKTTTKTTNDKYEGREALRQYLSSASIDLRMKPHFETYEDLLAEVKEPTMIWICYETCGGIPEVILAGDEAAARQWWKWNVEDRFDEEPCQYNDGITALTSWDEGHGFYGSSEGTEYRTAVMPYQTGVVA